MKIGIISHCTIDSILQDNTIHKQIGGPVYYSGLIAKNFQFDVELYTKFGLNFKYKHELFAHDFIIKNAESMLPTTTFLINKQYNNTQFYLKTFCEQISSIENIQNDSIIICPVFNEIDTYLFKKIKHDFNFVFLDPKGFLRQQNNDGYINYKKLQLDIGSIDVLKITSNTCFNIFQDIGKNAIRKSQKLGIKNLIYVDNNKITLFYDNKLFFVNHDFNYYEEIGIEDIFNAAFCCALLKEKDPIWALCFGSGAIQSAYEHQNKIKIPTKNEIEINAVYFYNSLKYEQL